MGTESAIGLQPFHEVVADEIRKLMMFSWGRDWPAVSRTIASHFGVLAASPMPLEAARSIWDEFAPQAGKLFHANKDAGGWTYTDLENSPREVVIHCLRKLDQRR